ncbi:IS5 family transposase [Actinosynnema sp. ALI-1.44]|nr:IS5 family transposase [Actinosynnema sp. ALI-1.44]
MSRVRAAADWVESLGGLPLTVMVVPADVQDRDLARDLLWRLRLTHPEITLVYADSAYSGELVAWAKRFLNLTITVVARPPGATGFVVLPRRWVVERSLSWLLRARRNVRDYERLPQHSEAALTWTAITLMTRRLTRTAHRHRNRVATAA